MAQHIKSTYPPTRPQKEHVIDDISFKKDIIVCLCSWKGPIGDYRAHRKEHGQTRH